MKQFICWTVLLGILFTAPLRAPAAETPGPLAAYVAKPDESFKWVKRREGKLGLGDYAELTLTSQTWRNVVWRHQLYVYKPTNVSNASQALLMIGGGRWKDELAGPPNGAEGLPREATIIAAAAELMKSPVAILLHVPQQPIFGDLVEDQAISYTFDQYLKTQDPEWPMLLPMVKSAVRGMDAVQQFVKNEWSLEVKNFTVTGGSKRGWTTWLTGAIDKRASALAPMVIDVLNMTPQMKHQVETWGKFSEQIADYTQRGIQDRTGTPAGQALNAIVDPYSYRKDLSQPKLILLGTNDRYWPLDALNLYWDGLLGDKYVCYVPNNGHGLKDIPRIVGGLSAIHRGVTGKLQLPKLSWSHEHQGNKLRLSVQSDIKPTSVAAWIATAPTKDFRDAVWKSESTVANGTSHQYELDIPTAGYAAMFGEAVFDDAGTPYFLSTQIRIVKAAPTAGQ